MLAFRIEKKGHIKKLLKVKWLHIPKGKDSDDSDDEYHGSDYLENMKLPVRCYSVAQTLSKEERWWEDKSCIMIYKSNVVRFRNDEDLESSQLNSIVLWSRFLKIKEEYFVGLCQHCYSSASPGKKLSRCGGCQLVGYCSKNCQKADRKHHKEACNALSVSHCGMNVLQRAQDVVKGIKSIEKKKELLFAYLHLVDTNNNFLQNDVSHMELERTTDMVEECDIEFRFNVLKFPRICNMCCEAQIEKLQDCNCNCVTYCSDKHRNADEKHQARCKSLGLLAATYAYRKQNELINNITYPSQVDNIYQSFQNMESLLNSFNNSNEGGAQADKATESSHIQSNLVTDTLMDVKLALLSERLSLPLTVLHILSEVGVGPEKTPLENVTSLHIHNLCFQPMLDSGAWEFFMHRLPRLKQLLVSYTEEQAVEIHSKSINHLNTNTTLTRCQDCTNQERLITYAIYPFHYEVYVSMKYPEPDVITVAECRELIEEDLEEMMMDNADDDDEDEYDEDDCNIIRDFYINLMQHKGGSRVIFTDNNHQKLCETISSVNDAVPIDALILPKENPFAGFSQVRTMDTNEGQGTTTLNCRKFISCLIRNNEKSAC